MTAPRGAFVMSVTPFAAGGAVDERLLLGHVDWLAAAGVGIFLCSQGSGEGDLLRADEKRRVYEIGVDAAAGRVPVWAAGVGLAGASADIAALARDAYAAGVDGVYVLGPRPSPAPLRADEVEAYYRAVIEAVDGPVIVADNTYLTGYALPDGVLAALVASYPQIAAVVVAGAGTDPAAVTVDVPVLVGNTAPRAPPAREWVPVRGGQRRARSRGRGRHRTAAGVEPSLHPPRPPLAQGRDVRDRPRRGHRPSALPPAFRRGASRGRGRRRPSDWSSHSEFRSPVTKHSS